MPEPQPPEEQAQDAADGQGSIKDTASTDNVPMPSASEALKGAKKEKGPLPHRWQVVLMIACAFVLSNLDKVNMSVAVIPMARELGWSGLERGLVSSAFFWGYTLTQVRPRELASITHILSTCVGQRQAIVFQYLLCVV